MIKVAHFTILTPGRCGLYETTRELVTHLRQQGIDSRLVDPLPDANPIGDQVPVHEDRGAKIADLAWAKDADLFVSHSGIGDLGKQYKNTPIIQVAHGRPYNSFISETSGNTPIYSHHYNSLAIPTCRAA